MKRLQKLVLVLGLALAGHSRAADGGAAATVEGRVIVAATGQPLSGVKLRWWRNTNDVREPVPSSADGSFRIENIAPGKGVITAAFPGEPVADWVAEDLSLTLAPGEIKKDVVILALKGGVASFTVLSRADRKPLSGVRVSASSQLSPSPSLTVTGADGVATLRLLPDRWLIAANAEGWSGWRTNLMVETGRTGAVEVLVDPVVAEPGSKEPVFKITGTLRDADGAPVGGAVVSVRGFPATGQDVKTGANGRYEVTWSKQRMRAMDAFIGGGEVSTLVARSVERNLAVTHIIDEHITNLDLTLQPCVTLWAKVEDPRGQPITNAEAIVYSMIGSGYGKGGETDSQGRFEFAGLLPAESYLLQVTAKGYGAMSEQIPMPSPRTNRLEFPTIVMPLADKKLGGKILDADGKPVAGVQVQAWAISYEVRPVAGEADAWNMEIVQGRYQGAAQTDSEGNFFYDEICEGPIQLRVSFRGPALTLQTTGGTTNLVLSLENFHNNAVPSAPPIPVVKISGTVRNPAGAPAAGVRLSLSGDYGQAEVRTDSDGRYLLTVRKPNSAGAPHGLLVARDEEHNLLASHSIDERNTNVDLGLQPGLTLSVHVRDTNGNPIAGAAATLRVEEEGAGWNFAPMRIVADDQGLIGIKALPQGRYYTASITARGFGSVQMEAPDADTHTTHFAFPDAVLPLADLEVAGQVLDPAGKPAPNARITLTGGPPYKTDNTDADGRFAFYGLCKGTSSIYVESRSTNFELEGHAAARSGDTNVVIRMGDVSVNQRTPLAPVANRDNPARPPADVVNGPMVTNYGRVLDASGAPVSGVVLAIAPYNGMQPRATNDANGNFTIVWPKWSYAMTRTRRFICVRDLEHNLSASHEVDETSTNLELRLQPGLPLSVKVLDANGDPIRTATANLRIFTGTAFLPFDLGSQFNGRADDHGLIEIKTLPHGLRYSLGISAKGYGFTNIELQFGDTQTNGLDFPAIVLNRTDRKLAGLVLGQDGNPLPEAIVSLNGAGQKNASTTADAQGHYVFNSLVEGSVRLQASGGPMHTNINRIGVALAEVGETNAIIRIGVDGGPQLEADALARRGLTNAGVRPATNAPTAPPQGPTITTLVNTLDPSGAPAAGVTLSLLPTPAVTISDMDAIGKTTISWHPKFYPTPLLIGRDLEHNQAAFLILDQMSTNVTLRLQEGFTLCGSVQDDKGAALGTASVALNIVRPGLGAFFQSVKVDEHGDFTLRALLKGQDYTVTASGPGFFSSSNFLVQADQTQTARLQLLPIHIKGGDFPLEGMVVAPDGKPVAGAIVRAAGTGQPNGSATTDDSGHFVLRANEGTLHVTASVLRNHPGGVFNSGTIEAKAGETNLVVRLTALSGAGAAAPRTGAPSSTNSPPSAP